MEILDAYNSTRLVISGNSSHLAPWHAKLGFHTGPCISTLNHLNGDGGSVAVMAIAVIKVGVPKDKYVISIFDGWLEAYPLAFIEFMEEEDGTKRREGPRSQNEEAQVNEKWKVLYTLTMILACGLTCLSTGTKRGRRFEIMGGTRQEDEGT